LLRCRAEKSSNTVWPLTQSLIRPATTHASTRQNSTQSCKASFEREGFEKDCKHIASATSEDFVNAVLHESQPRSNQDLLRNAGNERARAALRNLGFSTATVPLTDGNKMRLRLLGCAMNTVFGSLTMFHTHNYADNYSPEILKLQGAQPPIAGNVQNIAIPTLQQMHKNTAVSPRSTAKLFLLLEELSYGHLYRVRTAFFGNFRISPAASNIAEKTIMLPMT
jgi:hypothetical protein